MNNIKIEQEQEWQDTEGNTGRVIFVSECLAILRDSNGQERSVNVVDLCRDYELVMAEPPGIPLPCPFCNSKLLFINNYPYEGGKAQLHWRHTEGDCYLSNQYIWDRESTAGSIGNCYLEDWNKRADNNLRDMIAEQESIKQ